MKRPLINMLVDFLSLLVFSFMISTGLLLKFVLPPRSGRETCFGLTRHEWGDVHFYVSILFLTVLFIHILLHWAWIQSMLWGTSSSPQPTSRKIMTVAVLILVAAILLFPWIG
jgi:hypothetical protein